MYKVLRSWRDEKNNLIFHDTGLLLNNIYRDVRAGLTWPSKDAPGYFIILGQFPHKNEMEERPLILIKEMVAKGLKDLFQSLSDAAQMFLYESVYTDLSDECEGYIEMFRDFCSKNEIRKLYLKEAPWISNFQYGLYLIQEILGNRALEIDKHSIIGQQLGKIPKGDPGERPEETFFAVNALRHVVGAYKKYGVGVGMTPEKAEELKRKYGPPRRI
jgi:hypothetical protein